MIEVHQNLFVGGEIDEWSVGDQPGWFFIHACKEPYHRRALGYTGQGAPKNHPEYLIARRDQRLILNLVDVPNVNYISSEILDAALDAIHSNIEANKLLLHCNLGKSRSPTIALLYLLKFTNRLNGLGFDEAVSVFREIYSPFDPGRGMADYARLNWQRYRQSTLSH